MKIVGLCGFANSGKSSIAKYLVKNYGFVRLSFAGPVKDVASVVYGWDRFKLDGQTEEDRIWRETSDFTWSKFLGRNITPRIALQQIGQGMRDIIDPNIWVHMVRREIEINENTNFVIDDVRYVNERMMLKDVGANLYIVHRADHTGITFPSEECKRLWEEAIYEQVLSVDKTPLHRSEWDWLRDPTITKDPIIENCGNLENLHTIIENTILKENI